MDEDASELLGRGAKRGLLSWLPNNGTIILNNIHKAPPAVLPLLEREVATASYAASVSSMDDYLTDVEEEDDQIFTSGSPSGYSVGEDGIEEGSDARRGEGLPPRPYPPCRFPRFIMTAETRVPELESFATVIKVPPLRLRPEDLGGIANSFLRSLSKQKDLGFFALSTGALRQLEAGQYPNNHRELWAALERAVVQTIKSDGEAKGTKLAPRILGEEVFWFANPAKDRLRMNLLTGIPLLRPILRSEFWPRTINFKFTAYVYAALVALLFLGPQDREHNFALNMFWCYWWPGIFVLYPILGRIWCSVCPFMIYGELVQKVRLAAGAKLQKWPKETLERWGPWFLFSLFGGILVWEEVWDLPNTACLSSWLLLLITAGAVIGSFFYERRVWCRYLCPIGGMNGMFAKLSLTELRARQGVCSAECITYGCYKGSPPVPPEGLAADGCPLYSHPAQLTDNRNCVLCMDCMKACPHSSVELKLRVPGADLWDGAHTPVKAEHLCLCF